MSGGRGREEKHELVTRNPLNPAEWVSEYPMCSRVQSVLFYAVCAILTIAVNDRLLVSYKFPSLLALALGQMVATIVVIAVLRLTGLVQFPTPHRDILKQIWPLALMFCGNLVFSLGGTDRLNTETYLALRRFSILFIMAGEYFILGHVSTLTIHFTVVLMVVGSFITAIQSMGFDARDYLFIFADNICSALGAVIIKQKLSNQTLSKYDVMLYSSMLMVIPTVVMAYLLGDIHKVIEFDQWRDPFFLAEYVMACLIGFVTTFSAVLCVQHNSALTLGIVGVLKNMIVIYSGMIINRSYIQSVVDFLGVHLSVTGGFLYLWVTFTSMTKLSSASEEVDKV